MKYLVTATSRKNPCDRRSAIVALQLDKMLNGGTIHDLKDLVMLSTAHQLWVNLGHGIPAVRVEVFWSNALGRYEARTVADSTTKNNLDNLPMVRPKSYQNQVGVTYYETCSL